MQRYFATDLPAGHFLRNTLAFSLLSLLPVLLLHIGLTPGFTEHLKQGGPALSRYLRQVFTNGLPVVFAVNYLSFFLLARGRDREEAHAKPVRLILTDLLVRLVIFILLHAVIYVASAGWFDSFGGDRMTALRVVGPTLSRAAHFENLSGVYLYATLISALPLYSITIAEAAEAEPDGFLSKSVQTLPMRSAAILIAAALCAVFLLALTGVAASFSGLLGRQAL